MYKGLKVIDADAHMHEPQDMWEKSIEPKYKDKIPKVAFMDGVFMVYEPDGYIIPKGDPQQRPSAGAYATMEAKYGDAYRQWWSPQIRLADMDRYGWDIQVLLPTGNNGNFAYRVALKDLAIGAAMCRAYNNWCADYCSADPKRLKFVAVLPGSDVKEMVREAKRAVTELGAVSVRNPVVPKGRYLHESEYDELWKLACDLDFPISAHGEYRNARFQPFRQALNSIEEETRLALEALDHAIGFPADNMTTMGHFIFTGIFDRFPSLRLGVLESNSGWLPFWLGRMDDHTHGRNSVIGKTNIKMKPTDYFMRNCVIACDSDERALRYVVDYLDGENIVWNTDYPHPDAIEPQKALPELDAQNIPAPARKKILWDNSVKLYGERILN